MISFNFDFWVGYQLGELGKMSSPEELFTEMGHELHSLEADRTFLEGEVVRHQEKFEHVVQKLRWSEDGKSQAQKEIEQLRKELDAERAGR